MSKRKIEIIEIMDDKNKKQKSDNEFVNIPDNLSFAQKVVVHEAMKGKNIFFTGEGGTGKSYLIATLKKVLKINGRNIFITSSTGKSACDIGGTTIHKLSQIGLGDKKAEAYYKTKNKNIKKPNLTIIIDEISMISAELFELLDKVYKKWRNNDKYFGGVQMIVCGDFYQLPPAQGTRCFQSEIWDKVFEVSIILDKVFRQKDNTWLNILREVRMGKISDENYKLLRERVKEPPKDEKPTILFSTNVDVIQRNKKELSLIKSESMFFVSIDKCQEIHKNLLETSIVPKVLELKVGCKVMLLKNLDIGCGLVNGAIGTVTAFNENKSKPIVSFEKIKNKIMDKEDFEISMNEEVIASRKQFPLILAYALTIHKSQGSTLHSIYGNPSDTFLNAQFYVFLSRCVSLRGIYLQNLEKKDIKKPDKDVVDFYEKLGTLDKKIRKEYE